MIDRVFILLSMMLCLLCSSSAQTAGSTDQETVNALVKEVSELKARIAVLEAKQSQAEAAPAPGPGKAVSAEVPPIPAQAPASEPGKFELVHGIKMQGFGAVTYKANDANPAEAASLGFRAGSAGNFAVGDVDLFLTSQITTKALVLAEVSFSETTSQEFETDVERVLLKYDPNDHLKMSFGRFHTATSYYNSIYHHGLWLQTAADRPLVVEFSDHGGLLPSQAVGASLTGRVPSGSWGLNYIFEYGSASTIRPQINSPSAGEIVEHNGNEITAGLFIKPDWLPGLDLRGSFYHDRLNPEASGLHISQSVEACQDVY